MKKKELTISELVFLLKKKKSISEAERTQIIAFLKQLGEINKIKLITCFWNSSGIYYWRK